MESNIVPQETSTVVCTCVLIETQNPQCSSYHQSQPQTPSTSPSRFCLAFHPSQAVVSTLSPFSHLQHVSPITKSRAKTTACTSRANLLSQQPHHRLTDNIRLPRLLRHLDIALILHQLFQRTVGQAHRRFPWLPVWEHVDLGFEGAEGVDGCWWCHQGRGLLMEKNGEIFRKRRSQEKG